MVSVIVPAHDTQSDFLDEALESLRGQEHRNLEIIVMPHSRCDRVTAIARRHASEDWRILVHPEVSETLGTARNRGADLARGEFLAFAGGADIVPPAGIQKLVATLESTGSEFAVGRLSRADAPTGFGGSGQQTVHRRQRRATNIAKFPVAITDSFEENRLFRTTFWKDSRFEFPEGRRSVVRSPIVEAYIRASSFDVITDVTYRWMNRGTGLPFGHLQNAMGDLDQWLTAQRETAAVLTSSSPAIRDAWVYGVLDTDAIPFLDDAERANDQQWAALREYLGSLVESAGPDVLPTVRAEPRVKVWLAVHNHRVELEELVASRWFEQDNRPTEVREGLVYAALPFYQDMRLGIPDSCFVMSEAETALNLSLRDVRWADPHTIELDLFAFIRYVAFDEETPDIEASLVDPATKVRLPLKVRQYADPEVTRAAGQRYQSYDRGALTVTINAEEFVKVSAEVPAGTTSERLGWWLDVRVSARGLRRTGTINHRDERGSAGALRTGAFAPRTVGSRRVDVVPDPEHGIRILPTALPPLVLTSAEVTGRVVHGGVTTSGRAPVAVRASLDDLEVEAALTQTADGLGFRLELPETRFANLDTQTRHWKLRAAWSDGEEQAIGWPAEVMDSWLATDPANGVALHRTPQGNCEVSEVAETAVVDEVRLEEGRIRVRGRWLGAAPETWSIELKGRRPRLPAAPVSSDGMSFEAEIPTWWDEWGLARTCIPTGHYRLVISKQVDGEQVSTRLLMSSNLLDRLSAESLNDEFRMRVVRAGRDVGINLSAPLKDDERGPYNQKRMQTRVLTEQHEVDQKAVYLQSYAGGPATDSQLAIHQELRKQRPDLTLYWGITDRSAAVPEGAVPLIMQSRDWYRVMATARYLVNNIDFDRWFVKRPDQYLLQTFHGYPAKSMGSRLWSAKKFTRRRIDLEIERTSRDWDLILTPCPEMDRYYREEYRYDGKIHSRGYPRDDVLRSPEADEVRRRTRERLRIKEGQVAVLYAPTWRDDLATSHRSAPIVRHLDLETATQALGDDFVFLMRGHRFHAKGAARSESRARLVDVTDYPEINDLILASDAAVLDYSSLRFDFALTGRPMLFLVPDLHLYTGGVRGFLYDFRDSAPGPLLDTADQVVERLRDLGTVSSRHAEDYQRFNEKYNHLQDGHATKRVVAEFFGQP